MSDPGVDQQDGRRAGGVESPGPGLGCPEGISDRQWSVVLRLAPAMVCLAGIGLGALSGLAAWILGADLWIIGIGAASGGVAGALLGRWLACEGRLATLISELGFQRPRVGGP